MMIVSIDASEHHRYREVLTSMFQTRKRVFADTLGWDVSVQGEIERDRYDDLDPIYLLWCDRDRSRHYGSVRLLPTTGPTLLHDVFRRTFPKTLSLTGPGIWEGTRMCLDERLLARDYPGVRKDKVFSLFLVVLCEFALSRGIHTLISNYEPHFKRVYLRAGAPLSELGRADGFGRYPVCCGSFEVSETVLVSMRSKLGLSAPLYEATTEICEVPLLRAA